MRQEDIQYFWIHVPLGNGRIAWTNRKCLIVALSALALVITGIIKRKVALMVTGQLLGVVALFLVLSQLGL